MIAGIPLPRPMASKPMVPRAPSRAANPSEGSLRKHLKTGCGAQGGTLQLKKREGWLDSLGSEILVGKDILGFLKNIDLDKS